MCDQDLDVRPERQQIFLATWTQWEGEREGSGGVFMAEDPSQPCA